MSDERVSIPSAWGVPGFSVEVRFLRECLQRQGYALVPTADVPTPEERAVLEAMRHMASTTLQQATNPRENNPQGKWCWPAEAELARRAAKEKKP